MKRMPSSFVQMGSCIEYGKKKSPQKENMICNPKLIKQIMEKLNYYPVCI